jgi:hypothetical protein
MARRIVLILALAAAGCSQIGGHQAEMLNRERIGAAVEAYEQAHNKADALGMCVKAKLVAIAYGEAHDLAEQRAWQAREAQDCRAAYGTLSAAAPAAR